LNGSVCTGCSLIFPEIDSRHGALSSVRMFPNNATDHRTSSSYAQFGVLLVTKKTVASGSWAADHPATQLHSLAVAKDYVSPETIAEAAVTNTAGGWCGGLQKQLKKGQACDSAHQFSVDGKDVQG